MSISGKISMTVLRFLSRLAGDKLRITSMEEEIQKGIEISEKTPLFYQKTGKQDIKKLKSAAIHVLSCEKRI